MAETKSGSGGRWSGTEEVAFIKAINAYRKKYPNDYLLTKDTRMREKLASFLYQKLKSWDSGWKRGHRSILLHLAVSKHVQGVVMLGPRKASSVCTSQSCVFPLFYIHSSSGLPQGDGKRVCYEDQPEESSPIAADDDDFIDDSEIERNHATNKLDQFFMPGVVHEFCAPDKNGIMASHVILYNPIDSLRSITLSIQSGSWLLQWQVKYPDRFLASLLGEDATKVYHEHVKDEFGQTSFFPSSEFPLDETKDLVVERVMDGHGNHYLYIRCPLRICSSSASINCSLAGSEKSK